MSKLIKDMISDDLAQRYAALDSAVWVELVGVDGVTTTEFRRNLRTRKMRVEIVKTSLFRRAVGKGPLNRLADALDGPAAIISGGESAIDIGKALEEWAPKLKGLKLRGAVVDGDFIDERAVEGLAKMPTKRDLQARVAGVVRSPGANLAAAILSGGGRIAGAIKGLIEMLEKGENPRGVAAAAPVAAPEVPAADAPSAEAPPA